MRAVDVVYALDKFPELPPRFYNSSINFLTRRNMAFQAFIKCIIIQQQRTVEICAGSAALSRL